MSSVKPKLWHGRWDTQWINDDIKARQEIGELTRVVPDYNWNNNGMISSTAASTPQVTNFNSTFMDVRYGRKRWQTIVEREPFDPNNTAWQASKTARTTAQNRTLPFKHGPENGIASSLRFSDAFVKQLPVAPFFKIACLLLHEKLSYLRKTFHSRLKFILFCNQSVQTKCQQFKRWMAYRLSHSPLVNCRPLDNTCDLN